jgi:PII-like signaling protein
LNTGKAFKVSIYVSEGGFGKNSAKPSEILNFLFYRGVAGATVLKGVAGFGADHHLHSSSFVELSDRLPVKIEFIETEEKIDELLGKLSSMCGTGMIEIQETRIIKAASTGNTAHTELPAKRVEGRAKMIRVYICKDDVWNEKPLHVALVEAMRANDISGVTVYEGLTGYGAGGRLRAPGAFSKGQPLMLSVVDTQERIESFLPILERMLDRGLIALSDVEVIKYSHSAIPAAQQEEERSHV